MRLFTGRLGLAWHRSPRPAVALEFGTQPAAVVSGATMDAFTVQLVDQFGNVVPYTGPITVALADDGDGALALGGTVTVAAVAGVATFSAVVPTLSAKPTGIDGDPVAGYEFALVATATGLTSATSDDFGVTWSPASAEPVIAPTARSGVTAVDSTFTITSTGAAVAGQHITIAGVALVADTDWAVSGTVGTQAANIRDAINAAPGLTGIASATASSGVVTVTITQEVTVTENCDNVALGGNAYVSADGKAYEQVTPLAEGSNSFSQATESRRPLYVANSGQSYLQAVSSTSKLADSSTGASFDYNTPRTLGGVFYYPASVTSDGVFIGTGDGVNSSHTTSIGAFSNTILQFAAATTNNGTNGLLLRKTVSNLQGTWFTWLATFDGTDADGAALYLNGVLQTSVTVTWNTLSSGTAPDSSVQLIGIGGGNSLAGMRYADWLADDRAWSAGEVALYHAWADATNPSFSLP